MNYKAYLTDNVFPFWLDHALDEKYGGIFTCLDEKGTIYGEQKSVWFQGRALYIFSRAYNHGLKNPDYLKAAETIFRFLPFCSDQTGRMYFTVTRDGREIRKRRYFFSETFAAIYTFSSPMDPKIIYRRTRINYFSVSSTTERTFHRWFSCMKQNKLRMLIIATLNHFLIKK